MTSDSDIEATRLEANIYPVEDWSEGCVPEFDEDELDRVAELIKDHGFRIAEDSYDATLLTTAFVTSEENVVRVEEIADTLDEWYPEADVEYESVATPNNVTGDLFPVTQMVTVEDDRGQDAASEADGVVDPPEECPECGEVVRVDEEDETVCTGCGLVIESLSTDSASESPEWRAFTEGDEDKQRVGSPEVADGVEVERDREIDRDWVTERGPPDGEVVVGIVSEPYRTEHEYYRIDDAEEFFGEDWEDSDAMANRIHEAGLEPFQSVSLPDADWIIPSH